MEFLQNYYKKALIDKINAKSDSKLKTDASLEEIFPMMKCLAEKSDGPEEIYWIPLEYKRLLFYIIHGNNGRIHTQITAYVPNESCEATCSIFLKADGNEFLLTDAIKYRSVYDSDPFVSIPAERRNVIMRDYAMAAAERTALFKAGICMDFSGDLDSENPENPNNPDPTSPLSPEQQKSMENIADVLKKEAEEMDTTSDTTSQTETENNELDTNTVPDIVLFGNKKDLKLSEMSPKYLAWMLNQIDIGKQKVEEKYRAKIAELVFSNEAAKAIYDKNMEEYKKSA